MDDSRIRANEDPLFRLKPVLVTGATGYVGGRLVPRLLEAGYRVRVMSRSMESFPPGFGPIIPCLKRSGGMCWI